MASFMKRPATDTQVAHWQRLWLYVFVALVLVVLILPTLIVIPISFTASSFMEFPPRSYSLRWYRVYLQSSELMDATWISLQVATLTTLVATPCGVAAAYGVRCLRTGHADLLAGIVVLPLIVPVILIAIGLFFVYIPLGFNNTILGLVVAHTGLSVPFVFVIVLTRLRQFDFRQEQAAQSLGANRGRAFLTVTLPQIKFSVIAGALLAFITSFDEAVVAYFVGTGPMSTLTRRMFMSLEYGVEPTIAAISTLLVALTVLIVVVTQILVVERPK
ncbi:MAG: ABC transporter permease [Proteobacteria bacterium]|nr:ABC transporter permease [Pseudomonadota bacterium]MBI3500139.1 ABC transporter permease [Pseudomonadota bacterium]